MCEKRHDNVLRDIEEMLAKLDSSDLRSQIQSSTYADGSGIPRKCYNLPKRETLILVSGYNVELRAKIIDRWQELEVLPGPLLLRKETEMADLIAVTSNLTMSSREIAEMCEKQHNHVLRDIDEMLSKLDYPDLDSQIKPTTYADGSGIQRKCYNLPKRETLILVSGYNLEFRAKIIDRWQELEAAQGPKLPKTFSEALRLAAEPRGKKFKRPLNCNQFFLEAARACGK
jgi:phage regulator Rha-like protein